MTNQVFKETFSIISASSKSIDAYTSKYDNVMFQNYSGKNFTYIIKKSI